MNSLEGTEKIADKKLSKNSELENNFSNSLFFYILVQSLEKCMYLATTMIAEKWTQSYHNLVNLGYILKIE